MGEGRSRHPALRFQFCGASGETRKIVIVDMEKRSTSQGERIAKESE
jgi:hypothetical protein